jgi:predicted amidohydrolase YtcJ
VALSDDLTKTQPARIHEVRVLTTVVGGKITYQAPQ